MNLRVASHSVVGTTLQEAEMLRTIVAGCNGRDRGRGAVALGHALAAATGARLLIVGVQLDPPVPFESYGTVREALEHDLKATRDELAPGARVRVAPGFSPAHALVGVAQEVDADLIVVGERHRGRLEHLLEPDHAMQVLHGADCAVAVAPDTPAPRTTLRRIGVGLDDVPEAEAALALARDLTRRGEARLVLCTVVDDAIPGWIGLEGTAAYATAHQTVVEARTKDARTRMEAALEACEGDRAEGAVVTGDPARELIALSRRVDLLVLGSRRWGPVRRLALGSTSERVIRSAECPVLVPPRPGGRGAEPPGGRLRGAVAT